MPYIHFTEEQKSRAASVDLVEFLRLRGEKLIRSGPEVRMASDHSVTVRGSEWYDHAQQKGGGPVSFVRRFYNLGYAEAVQLLLDENGIVYPSAKERIEEPPKPFELPQPNTDMRRVYAYLIKQRHIDQDVINYFARDGTIYEDAQYHNCVFVGRDENGCPRHAHKRSSNSFGKTFRANVESSDPRYSFRHVGTDSQLYVFEAPIDMLSYISLHPNGWQAHSYVACCGTSFIPVQEMLRRLPDCREVFLCLDNDHAGNMMSERMAETLTEQGLRATRLAPELKDWNDDLVAADSPKEVQSQCQTLG